MHDAESRLNDRSTAPLQEKLRRFLAALADTRGHSSYFHDDGYPRKVLSEDATAFLDLLEAGRITAGVRACPPGHCRTPSAPCRGQCSQVIQPRETSDVPVPCGVELDGVSAPAKEKP